MDLAYVNRTQLISYPVPDCTATALEQCYGRIIAFDASGAGFWDTASNPIANIIYVYSINDLQTRCDRCLFMLLSDVAGNKPE